MDRHLAAVHAAFCAAVIFLFGPATLSLSADFAQHFALIDTIMKYGSQHHEHVSVIWNYPLLSHWLAAGVGYIIGSGLVAMWLLSLLSIYAFYFFIAQLSYDRGNITGLVVFAVLIGVATAARATVGFEIVRNFLYAQLLATVIYGWVLVWLSRSKDQNLFLKVVAVLVCYELALRTHTLPALHIAGTFCIFLALDIFFGLIRQKVFRLNVAASLALFALCAVLLLLFDPSFRSMVSWSHHEGSLEFGHGVRILVVASLFALVALSAIVWKQIKSGDGANPVDAVVISALAAAVIIFLAQYVAIRFGKGSLYATKKHLFILTTMGLLAIARVSGYYFPKPSVRPLAGYAAIGSFLVASIVLWQPGLSLYPIVRQLDYAQQAAKFSFSKFKPNQTFVIADSIHPVVRYMISISAFEDIAADGKAVRLIDGSFNAKIDAPFLMIDNKSGVKCQDRYAETIDYVIVPRSCLQPPGGIALSFDAAGDGISSLSGSWFQPEEWGTWSGRENAIVTVHLPPDIRGSDLRILLALQAFLYSEKSSLTVDVAVNGQAMPPIHFPTPTQPVEIAVPKDVNQADNLTIVFKSRDAASPKSVGMNDDPRVLGMGLRSILVEKISEVTIR